MPHNPSIIFFNDTVLTYCYVKPGINDQKSELERIKNSKHTVEPAHLHYIYWN